MQSTADWKSDCLSCHRYLVRNSEQRPSKVEFDCYGPDGVTNRSTPRKQVRCAASNRQHSNAHDRDT